MAEIIAFPYSTEEPDLDGMDSEQLHALLEQVADQLCRLDDQEPEDMDSDAYQEWGQLHENLEDLQDDIMDRLDDLQELEVEEMSDPEV